MTADLVLGPMLRHVTATSATIWVETDRPCSVEVLGHTAATFTVAGHHYALVVVRDLEPGTVTPYEVHLDGERRWPAGDVEDLPASVIRTHVDEWPVRILFGSCRAAAPHHPPYTLERDFDDQARGVDALWAHARRMLGQPPEEWPDLAVFLGDQVYADDTSPLASERIERRREHQPARHADGGSASALPPDAIVADFEEYTWLYHEAWSGTLERWFFSVVPSAMIFDDHDMIDDWNISQSWVDDIRQEPWWAEHIIGGLVSYWIYQHLGNLSPDELEADGMLAQLEQSRDGTDLVRRWALESEAHTPVPGGYRFSHARHVGGVHLVVADCRNGRVLEPGGRQMLDDDEWDWVCEQALEPCDHLVIATSVPVFVPPGIHGLQQWNEAVCDGAWGRRAARWGERLRRSLDLEDWSAFRRSFDAMCDVLRSATGPPTGSSSGPATTTVVSGDIHFAYVAEVQPQPGCASVLQVVSSPMRNALVTQERGAIHLISHGVGSLVGRALARLARVPRPTHRFDLTDGPYFNNNIGLLEYSGPRAGRVVIERSREEDGDVLLEVVIDRDLDVSSGVKRGNWQPAQNAGARSTPDEHRSHRRAGRARRRTIPHVRRRPARRTTLRSTP